METVPINALQVVALAAVGVLLGRWVVAHSPLLQRFNVPSPIVGGFLLAIVQWAMRDRVYNFQLDTSLRDLAMVAFFTTVGFGARVALLRRGGKDVVVFLGLATLGAAAQNGVGVGLAKLFGLHPLLGVATGSVALTGGPATALAFGAEFEKVGVTGAGAAGLATAVVGILVGGVLGGALGGRLLKHAATRPTTPTAPVSVETDAPQTPSHVSAAVLALALAMGLGTLVSMGLKALGITLPAYVGAMLVAGILRAIDDYRPLDSARGDRGRIPSGMVDAIGDIALELFIVMALLSLPLWNLASLALPLVVMLAAQIALVVVLMVLVYRVMGADREAAVISAGYCGFMLGTTANAMACLRELTLKFGPAPRAWLVVPIVGAFLIDFINSLLVTGLMNFFTRG